MKGFKTECRMMLPTKVGGRSSRWSLVFLLLLRLPCSWLRLSRFHTDSSRQSSYPEVLFSLLWASVLQFLPAGNLARYRQPTDPGHPTSKIVSTGVFSVSRNPLYLGGIFILAGISLAFNLPWVLILLIPSIVACHYVLVAPEESYLAARFGEEYRLYTARVHRWIGLKQV